ncbi:hypothetical protein ED733_005755 [Metarhizium rileyi]|uniref:U1-type domain-containing protein n=1 Tax=Metarhizium rileyi (strain RCEF 4871) TaxID=1649241 RepID=A0A5C6GB48_METRR|nr:hypothetical protein ED733_005755 [Metarhizium rileyi]
MTEYWKNSPNYWCKHCAVYVRDSKLERQNHEATAKHQNAIKRSLRELHRNHERGERDKERARREIDRLNGVVTGSSSGSVRTERASVQGSSSSTEASLKRQREELAGMGVSVPDDFRGEMAIPGEWTVTSTRVVQGAGDVTDGKTDKLAVGVRKREAKQGDQEEDEEEEDAVKGLFKKPRRWGRDYSKKMPREEDEELDALLSGAVKLKDEGDDVKVEDEQGAPQAEPCLLGRPREEEVVGEGDGSDEAKVKLVEGDGDSGIAPAVVFKKRKPKGLRVK